MMKKIYKNYIVLSVIMLLWATSCNNDFMDRFPSTEISPEAYFKTVKDLELYTNTYYRDGVVPYFLDYVCDNYAAYADVHSNNNLIRGSISPETVSGWSDWGRLRSYNFFLDNVHKVSGDPFEIAHYIGLTRLLRAEWYYTQVKWYNDLPWYSTALSDTDEELLYKGRDPRTLVVDSIMADLDYAVENMSEDMGNRTQFSKWYALAIQARICLHEGTFRKYHDELNLQNTASLYLEKAVKAASQIMQSGKFSIDKRGGKEQAYRNVFTSMDLSGSPEMILYKDFDLTEQIRHEAGKSSFSFTCNFSRSLMESYEYLTEEGKAIPFTKVDGYQTKGFLDVFVNRDPRFSQTFMYPGYIKPGDSEPFRPNLNLGGYPCIKFTAKEADPQCDFYTDQPVSRYAEILLIYAEAKAELGELTQDDMDRTINEIRSRVEMPKIIISEIMNDSNLNEQYPGITDKALLQIRRERRIELVGENFRWDDLMRWKAGHLVEQVQQGIYIKDFGLFDFTGDGIPEIGVFKNEASNTVPETERGGYTFYYLENKSGNLNTFSLSNENNGYIIMNGEIGTRKFEQPKYYYWPIPQMQRVLNPNLEETIFW
ncbi:RagB/SusD family nutrient uptake outer membrane protein [Parabacteroides goldsteinii]|uniref:RagB/SusD family nutrient uptake outer membrane protein n=1 Tax=Parabacteroides goldsteinii TaxID=328812 RepID=UPI0022E70D1C|nr:RagB/SusD family nutrient uptake outer membrane protein [Parabacteroides goldsteinii]